MLGPGAISRARRPAPTSFIGPMRFGRAAQLEVGAGAGGGGGTQGGVVNLQSCQRGGWVALWCSPLNEIARARQTASLSEIVHQRHESALGSDQFSLTMSRCSTRTVR